MAISIRPLQPLFAAEVSGIDCRKPLTPVEIDAVEAGINEYAVLVFREQVLTDEEQIGFTRNFGELENYETAGHVRKREDQRLGVLRVRRAHADNVESPGVEQLPG